MSDTTSEFLVASSEANDIITQVFAFPFALDQFEVRLDAAIAQILTQFSRTKIQEWISAGQVKVDGAIVTNASQRLTGFEMCEVIATIEKVITDKPQDIPIDVVYEDEDIIVINKPRDLVVHPGAGISEGTLLNALLYHYPELDKVPRAGIVHRLDKDTTGLMVVARNVEAQVHLAEQLLHKKVVREYEAIAYGIITRGGKVDAPIGRHPTKRLQMAVVQSGKPAITHFRVMESFRNYTRLRLRLETGRTHQIRVHMSHIKHPLLGDITYGGSIRLPKKAGEALITAMRGFKRQALHAIKLELTHPRTEEFMQFEVDLPQDMAQLIEQLQLDRDQFATQATY